jgi:hypothetical protein
VSACAAKGIQVEQQFNKIIIHWDGAWLDKKDILVTHHLIDRHKNLTVRQMRGFGIADCCSQDTCDLMRQGWVS